MDIDDKLNDLETALKAGNTINVSKELEKLWKNKKIPSNHMGQYANLCNRARLYNTTILALHDYVRETDEPRPEHLKEYALAQLVLGCKKEALSLVEEIEKGDKDQADFIRGVYHFKLWEHEKAIPYFENYCQSKNLEEYHINIGKMNLAFAYNSSGNYEKANEVITEVIQFAEIGNHHLMINSCHSILIQISLQFLNFDKARIHLNYVTQNLKDKKSELYYSKLKWEAVIELHQDRTNQKAGKELLQIYDLCIENQFYELGRSCHYYYTYFNGDEDTTLYNYFGTPYKSYRRKLKSLHIFPKSIPEIYRWNPSRVVGQEATNYIDLSTGEASSGEAIPTNQLPFKLLRLLCSDFYRPFSIFEIFEHLFPEEFYIPVHSERKIKAVKSRLSDILKNLGSNLKVNSRKRFYQITGDSHQFHFHVREDD